MPKYQFQAEVIPQYLPQQSSSEGGVFSFSYTITIHNTGEVAAQLVSRHWVISDALGHTQQVQGLGVVGEQPWLRPGESFQYSSGCQLRTPSGTMHGSYHCVAEDDTPFECEIPLCVLEATSPNGDGLPLSARVLH